MDEKEMKSFLDKTGLPVAYSHFPDNQKPPFICFLSCKKYYIRKKLLYFIFFFVNI